MRPDRNFGVPEYEIMYHENEHVNIKKILENTLNPDIKKTLL